MPMLSKAKSAQPFIKGPWSPKLTYIYFIHFPETAEFYDNFDSNIGAQRSVNTEKFTFEVDNLQNDVENAPP